MRWALAALVVMIAGVAVAQPSRRYDLYIFDTGDGREIYAVAAAGRASALEVRGCGDVSLIAEAAEMVHELRVRRARDDDNVIIVHGRNSRTELGPCGADEDSENLDEEAQREDDATSLVVIENMSPSQTRNTLRTLDAAPVAIRERMIADLGL
ncbi:hypothetical protein [Terricaulis silvestris]|uniref:Uncharacterized protein n=1 Tax=Terricaulis silvestris TaxID=2686094 RepID=A0A6I6MND2_9CAUL|nr:hypothetical protein [Terricaulis silvestris]QGZ94444.1 hypothetical protein DSM104635_01262 [Terricaulis silvestris]